MTRLKYALSALLLVSGSVANAEYDEWTCRETNRLKLTELQCISCGIQSYFSNKAPGREVVPSERWMILLGLTARQTSRLNEDGKKPSDLKRAQQIRVIAQIQRYGFCTNYGDKRKGPSKNPSWSSYTYNFTNRGNVNDNKLVEIAESFGFSDKGWGNHADQNLRYLLNGVPQNISDYSEKDQKEGNVPPDFGDQSFADRRTKFQKRLKETLDSGYDVSGERKSTKPAIASTPDGDDLRVCLEQVDQMQSGSGDPLFNSFFQSTEENIKFCNSMADSCDLDGSSFCGKINASPRPAKYNPASKPSGLPAPPAPSKSNGGVN